MGDPAQSALLPFAAREALAYAAEGALLPLAALRPRRPTGHGPTVVMVHGYGSGRGAFTPLERSLREHGYQRFARHGFITRWKRFDDLVDGLDRFIREQVPGGPLVLLGHSIGGLLARAWLQRGGEGARRTRGLCTLSSPHEGLWIAPLLPAVPVMKDLAVESPTLARLKAGDRHLSEIPALSIVSSRDHFVRPAEGAAFAHAELSIVDHVGHVGVLFDADTQDQVASFLRRVAPPEGQTLRSRP
ncbi:MAG: alpha/beta fold hydrolase [Deltaproteobacteria bacterium]|nr:alpha/beta fold hydrolase [Deltaproteobacteria bacterium]